jgi:hypothetical protein
MNDTKQWRSDCCDAPAIGEVWQANVWQAVGFCSDCRDNATFHVEGDEATGHEPDPDDLIP